MGRLPEASRRLRWLALGLAACMVTSAPTAAAATALDEPRTAWQELAHTVVELAIDHAHAMATAQNTSEMANATGQFLQSMQSAAATAGGEPVCTDFDLGIDIQAIVGPYLVGGSIVFSIVAYWQTTDGVWGIGTMEIEIMLSGACSLLPGEVYSAKQMIESRLPNMWRVIVYAEGPLLRAFR